MSSLELDLDHRLLDYQLDNEASFNVYKVHTLVFFH